MIQTEQRTEMYIVDVMRHSQMARAARVGHADS